MAVEDEYFGSPAQVTLMRRGQHLWTLLGDNPRYGCSGRAVALVDPGDDASGQAMALARLQGAAACHYIPEADAEPLCEALRGQGLNTTIYQQCRGTDDAIAASRAVIDEYSLPDDLTAGELDAGSAGETVAGVAELMLSCGVMPVPGAALRGEFKPGICLFARDNEGAFVGAAASFLMNHPDHAHGTDAFWGLLATRSDRRGQRIALILGAMAILAMDERHGARGFHTGIQADNAPSMKMCARLAVVPSGWTYVACMDPAVFGNDSITR